MLDDPVEVSGRALAIVDIGRERLRLGDVARVLGDAGPDDPHHHAAQLVDDLGLVGEPDDRLDLLTGATTGITVRDAAGLGVRRISVGGALARTAWAGFIHLAAMRLRLTTETI